MVSPQQAELPVVTPTETVPSKGGSKVVSSASTINPVDIKSTSNALLPFINENTVEAITKDAQNKFRGQKGILSFGHRHHAVPVEKGRVIPSEKYFTDNLAAIAKANNITTIALESSADEIDKPIHQSVDEAKLARKEFESEISEICQKHNVDLAITKIIDTKFEATLTSKLNVDIPIITPILRTIYGVLFKLPIIENFILARFKGNTFDEFKSENLLYKKAKELDIKIVPIDLPTKDKQKNPLYRQFTSGFAKLFTIAFSLYQKEDLLPQMQEFLKKNKKYQKFIEDFQRLDHKKQEEFLSNCTSLHDELSTKIKESEGKREVTIASNLHKALLNSDGNLMTVLGSMHVMKKLPDKWSPSAIQQLADKGVATISIDLVSRDHEGDKATLSLIPKSTKSQYLRADCHPNLSNIDLSSYVSSYVGIETGIKLAQACDAIITIPKLAA